MRPGQASRSLLLATSALAALALPAHAERPAPTGAATARWSVSFAGLACGSGSDATGCRFVVAAERGPGAADEGVVTVVALDPAGRPLACWDGARLDRSAATSVHLLAPAEQWKRTRSFDVFVSAWGCWGTPEGLGPHTLVPRSAARRDPAVLDEARQRRLERLDELRDQSEEPEPLGPSGQGC